MIRCKSCAKAIPDNHKEMYLDTYQLCNKCYRCKFGEDRKYKPQYKKATRYFVCDICGLKIKIIGKKEKKTCVHCQRIRRHRVNSNRMKNVWIWVYEQFEKGNKAAVIDLQFKLNEMTGLG